MTGRRILHYDVLAEPGEGGPPLLRMNRAELRRGLAEAQRGGS